MPFNPQYPFLPVRETSLRIRLQLGTKSLERVLGVVSGSIHTHTHSSSSVPIFAAEDVDETHLVTDVPSQIKLQPMLRCHKLDVAIPLEHLVGKDVEPGRKAFFSRSTRRRETLKLAYCPGQTVTFWLIQDQCAGTT